jgi:hypothetical protein
MHHECERLGCTISSFVHLAVQRLLDNEPTLVTLEQAVKEFEGARIEQLFEENPYVEQILRGSVAVAAQVKAKAKARSAEDSEPHRSPHHVRDFVQRPIVDGPATDTVLGQEDKFEAL